MSQNLSRGSDTPEFPECRQAPLANILYGLCLLSTGLERKMNDGRIILDVVAVSSITIPHGNAATATQYLPEIGAMIFLAQLE